jgi:hypothetical protein
MKTSGSFVLLLILSSSFLFSQIHAQPDPLCGSWEGIFMGQFDIKIDFNKDANGKYKGRLKLYDGPQKIQDDELTKIGFLNNQVEFYIPAKSTPFRGEYDSLFLTIRGAFTFPDGSRHPLKVVKAEAEQELVFNMNEEPLKASLERELLLADLCFLLQKLDSLHPRLYAYTDPASFDILITHKMEQLPEQASLADFYLMATSITDAVRCSHTGLRLPHEALASLRQKGNYFPASLYFNDDRAFLLSYPGNNILLKPGVEIFSINGVPVRDIISKLLVCFPSEGMNNTTKYHELNKRFFEYFVLIDNSREFHLSFTPDGQHTMHTTVTSCSYPLAKVLSQNHPADAYAEFPVTVELLETQNTAILTIPTFAIPDVNRYNQFMDSLFQGFKNNSTEHLIIDLRGNSGGHPIFAAQLLSYLCREDFVYFKPDDVVEEFGPLYTPIPPSPFLYQGQSYLLVDGGCLSTAGHFISLAKYHQTSVIIGEEPGSTFRCNDMSRQFIMPYSGMEINVPTKTFTTAVKEENLDQGVVDIYVERDVCSIINKKDPAMEKAMEETIKEKIVEL